MFGPINCTETENITKALPLDCSIRHPLKDSFLLSDENLISAEYSVKPMRFLSPCVLDAKYKINRESNTDYSDDTFGGIQQRHEFSFLILQSDKVRLYDSCFASLYENGGIKHQEAVEAIYPISSGSFFGQNLFLLLTRKKTLELRSLRFSNSGTLISEKLDSICFFKPHSVFSSFEVFQSALSAEIICLWANAHTANVALLQIENQKTQPAFKPYQKQIQFPGIHPLTSCYYSNSSVSILSIACLSCGRVCLLFVEWEQGKEPKYYRIALSSISYVQSISILNPEFSILSTNSGSILISHSQIKSNDSNWDSFGGLFFNVNSSYTYDKRTILATDSSIKYDYCTILLVGNNTIYAVLSNLKGVLQYSKLLKLRRIDAFYLRSHSNDLLILEVISTYGIQRVSIDLNSLSFCSLQVPGENINKSIALVSKIYSKYENCSKLLFLSPDSTLWAQNSDSIVKIDPNGDLIQNANLMKSFCRNDISDKIFVLNLGVEVNRDILSLFVSDKCRLQKNSINFLLLSVRMNIMSFHYLVVTGGGELTQQKVFQNLSLNKCKEEILGFFATKDKILIVTSKEICSLCQNDGLTTFYSSGSQIKAASIYEEREEIVMVESSASTPGVLRFLIWSYAHQKLVSKFIEKFSGGFKSISSSSSNHINFGEGVMFTVTTTISIEIFCYSKGIFENIDKLAFARNHCAELSKNSETLLRIISKNANSNIYQNISAGFSVRCISRDCITIHNFDEIHIIINGQSMKVQLANCDKLSVPILKIETIFINGRLEYIFVFFDTILQVFQTSEVTNIMDKVLIQNSDSLPVFFGYVSSLQRLMIYNLKNHELSAVKPQTGKKVSIRTSLLSEFEVLFELKEIEFAEGSACAKYGCHILLVGRTKNKHLVARICEVYAKKKKLILKQRIELDLTRFDSSMNSFGQEIQCSPNILTAIDHISNELWVSTGSFLLCITLRKDELYIKKSFPSTFPIRSLKVTGNFISIITGQKTNKIFLAQLTEMKRYGLPTLLPLQSNKSVQNLECIIGSISPKTIRIKFLEDIALSLAIFGNLGDSRGILVLAHINQYGFTGKVDILNVAKDPVDIQNIGTCWKLLHKNGAVDTLKLKTSADFEIC